MLTVKDHNEQAAATYAAVTGNYWIEALRDGRHVLIRPLAEKDREREYAFIKRLSPESRHMRFLAQISEAGTSTRTCTRTRRDHLQGNTRLLPSCSELSD